MLCIGPLFVACRSDVPGNQPRPSSKLELDELGLLDLTREEKRTIEQGERVFMDTGCAGCHMPKMIVANLVITEPSQVPEFIEQEFPSGLHPVDESVDPTNPVSFDLTADQPDNVLNVRGREIHFGPFEENSAGGAIVRLYGDLKRHDMGSRLAENIDEAGTGEATFITKELWGVDSTGPYLHEGRATTLTEAILDHRGEADASRLNAAGLSTAEFAAMIAFLDNLILFKVVQEQVVILGKRRHPSDSGGGRNSGNRRRGGN